MSKNNLLEIVPFTKEEQEECKKLFTTDITEYLHVCPTRCVLTEAYGLHAANIYNMPLRSDDIVVTSFPRSGTTWTQELVWLITNELNFEKAKSVPLVDRYPLLEGNPNQVAVGGQDLKGKRARRVANFFGKSYSEEQLDQLCDYLSFENFKTNESVDLKYLRDTGICDTQKKSFIRKDKHFVQVSGWREYFEGELAVQVQNWIDENLRDTDLRFPSL
ncbi:sulfotransferase 1C2-like [Hyposmocoma kahamanoa]|uniref:sulfotransferase 1C2-like n=1 Tax=Hyposmocoma kahamanoa TaxID=1477025 RepID=UPI000E6DA488|nr:sulfotransferase 1C2-like [Hyposmocoma kahamanoa]